MQRLAVCLALLPGAAADFVGYVSDGFYGANTDGTTGTVCDVGGAAANFAVRPSPS